MNPATVTLRGRAVPRRTAIVAVVGGVFVFALAVAVVGLVLAQPPAPVLAVASPSPSPSPTLTPSPSPSPTPEPSPTPTPTPSPSLATDAVLGADGRFTVLLLGSDYRAAHPGNRTDVIMVVSLDPTTGAVAAASIPRDTASFPTSASGVYKPKVNGLYQALISKMGQTKAAREMKRIVGAAIGVEIDSYAVIGFEGVRRLIDTVGGVDVTLSKAVSDPHYWVTAHKQGVYFPKGRNHLNGERALIFARTRKGDNDFERARRQQMLVAAAVDAVRSRGLAKLPALVGIANRFVKTDLPLTAAPELFALVAKADLGHTQRVVFGPTKWASGGSGTSFSLKLGEVRKWTKQWMAPVAAPSPAVGSSASPSAPRSSSSY